MVKDGDAKEEGQVGGETVPFEPPVVHVNDVSWGPKDDNVPGQYVNLPYAPFGKGDRIGRAADFTAPLHFQNRIFRSRRGEDNVGNEQFQYKHDTVEDSMFELVDTTKTSKNKYGVRNRWNANRNKFQQNLRQQREKRGQLQTSLKKNTHGKGMASNVPKWQRKRQANMMRKPMRRRDNRAERQASVRVQADWHVLEEYELPALTKLKTTVPTEEVMLRCGFVDSYNDAFDRITKGTTQKLERCENKEFYYVTTTDDPVIEKFAVEGKANVFATDAILAHLMASPRSVYPWDIVVQKTSNMVFFDKRDNSQFDYLTVNETSNEPPPVTDDPDHINSPDRLSLEATMINQNFSQQILLAHTTEKAGGESAGLSSLQETTSKGKRIVPAGGEAAAMPSAATAAALEGEAVREKFEQQSPFFDPADAGKGMLPASVGYVYKRFSFGDKLNIMARCELHGTTIKRGEKQYMTAYALNEWDSKLSGSADWRKKIDTQRGAILATELKNNSNKLAKWTAQSLLAGAQQMKIGLVSRASRNNAYEHVVLGTQGYNPQDFANQITLSQQNMWAIIKTLAELVLKQPDGKFVILRDPNKAIVRVYRVPSSTFEDSDEESEDESEDDNSEDDK